MHTVDTRVGRRHRVVRIDEVIGRLGSAAGPDFRVAVRAQGVVFLRLGLALTDLVRFVQRRRGRTASAHLSVPVAIRLQSDGIGSMNWHIRTRKRGGALHRSLSNLSNRFVRRGSLFSDVRASG